MGIGINAHNPDEGLLKAKQESVGLRCLVYGNGKFYAEAHKN